MIMKLSWTQTIYLVWLRLRHGSRQGRLGPATVPQRSCRHGPAATAPLGPCHGSVTRLGLASASPRLRHPSIALAVAVVGEGTGQNTLVVGIG